MDPEVHYTIPPLSRLDLAEIDRLVQERAYFVLHAPRQTGKTSVLKALRDHLNEQGWRCVHASCEDARERRDPDAVARIVLEAISEDAAETLDDDSLSAIWPQAVAKLGAGGFRPSLKRWSEQSGDRRLVLLLDEADGLRGEVFGSLLGQLRTGHGDRPKRFPRSIVFCGLRDVRDYPPKSGSPFNIVEESLRLGDFSRAEVEELLGQHTGETGQRFAPGAVEEIWNATAGQPWLVNALADETCFRDEAGRDRTREIGVEAVEAARERLFRKRPSHIRHLEERLTDLRVRRVIEPLLAGRREFLQLERDDSAYVRDLGFVKAKGPLKVANPIYRDAIPRILSGGAAHRIPEDIVSSRRPDGSPDVSGLLTAFREFFGEHSEQWSRQFVVREAGLHLLLQAFWQRVVMAGGRIVPEYGLGMARTDLLIERPRDDGGAQRFVVECRVRRERDDLETVIREGAAQTAAYLDRCGAEEGHLAVMDRDEDKTREQKMFRRALPVRRASAPDSEPGWEVVPDGDPPETLSILAWGM